MHPMLNWYTMSSFPSPRILTSLLCFQLLLLIILFYSNFPVPSLLNSDNWKFYQTSPDFCKNHNRFIALCHFSCSLTLPYFLHFSPEQTIFQTASLAQVYQSGFKSIFLILKEFYILFHLSEISPFCKYREKYLHSVFQPLWCASHTWLSEQHVLPLNFRLSRKGCKSKHMHIPLHTCSQNMCQFFFI